MAARAVRISLDKALMQRIDEDAEARERGRSAFIRTAVEAYLSGKELRRLSAGLEQVYAGRADVMLAEVQDLLDRQRWPGGHGP